MEMALIAIYIVQLGKNCHLKCHSIYEYFTLSSTFIVKQSPRGICLYWIQVKVVQQYMQAYVVKP